MVNVNVSFNIDVVLLFIFIVVVIAAIVLGERGWFNSLKKKVAPI